MYKQQNKLGCSSMFCNSIEDRTYCLRFKHPRVLRWLHCIATCPALLYVVLTTVSFWPISQKLSLASYDIDHKYDCSEVPVRFTVTCGNCYQPDTCCYSCSGDTCEGGSMTFPFQPKGWETNDDNDQPCDAMCGAPPYCSNRGTNYQG